MVSNEALTLNEIYEIAEISCTTDCARYRSGTCPYQGRDKISCYLWQAARAEYEDKREKCIIFVLVEGMNVKGVFHTLQRAKRAIDHLDDQSRYQIIQEKVAYGPNGGVYHLYQHKWEWKDTWRKIS